MKLEHISNNGPLTFSSFLEDELTTCTSFSIGVAFISHVAVDLIERVLKKNKRLKSGELLISAYRFFNDKDDLSDLVNLCKRYSDRLRVHISLNKSFHWKYYMFQTNASTVFYIGSANFTNGGLGDNGELMVRTTFNAKERSKNSCVSLIRSFSQEWTDSKPITDFPLSKYPIIEKRPGPKVPSEIAEFFKQSKSKSKPLVSSDKLIVCSVHGYLSTRTVEIINRYKSTWDKKYDYFSASKSQFELCQSIRRMLVVWKEKGKYFYSSVIAEEFFDSAKTPDGRYFVAYKPRRSKRFIESEMVLLREMGIALGARKKPFVYKVLGKAQTRELIADLK